MSFIAKVFAADGTVEELPFILNQFTGSREDFTFEDNKFTMVGSGSGDVYIDDAFKYVPNLSPQFYLQTFEVEFEIPYGGMINFYLAGNSTSDYSQFPAPGTGVLFSASGNGDIPAALTMVAGDGRVRHDPTVGSTVNGYMRGIVSFTYSSTEELSVTFWPNRNQASVSASYQNMAVNFANHIQSKFGFSYYNPGDFGNLTITNYNFLTSQDDVTRTVRVASISDGAEIIDETNGTNGTDITGGTDDNGEKPKDSAISLNSLSAVLLSSIAVVTSLLLLL